MAGQSKSMQDTVLIGVDGGATKVSAWQVRWDGHSLEGGFELGNACASAEYPRVEGFQPIAIAEQLAVPPRASIKFSQPEEQQGRDWVECTARVIADVARACRAGRILVGLGMPGLKTVDGRGIRAINNGPRIPRFLDDLQAQLVDAGMAMAGPIARLGSDADYCGLGEEYASPGLFRGVSNAYYVGGGTGLADALKLGGRLVRFDEVASWMLKSWQMTSSAGATYERMVSAAGMNARYAEFIGTKECVVGADRFPEVDAAAGSSAARAYLGFAAGWLAELIFERMDTVKNGRSAGAQRGEAYSKLDANHPYRGTLLERVVVGQQLGRILLDECHAEFFRQPLERWLAASIEQRGDEKMRSRYLSAGALIPGFLVGSTLRAAPALGAAIDAARSAWGSAGLAAGPSL